ncbi:MAG: cation-translocating P-type ATPase [Candidatus Thorarchaeota archaeon]
MMTSERTETSDEYVDYKECLLSLGANPEGLTDDEVIQKSAEFGENTLTLGKGDSPLIMFFRQFKSPLVYVLLLAAAISYIGGHAEDTIVIAVILLINSIIGFVQEWRAERTIESVKRLIEEKSVVVRNGTELEIKSLEIVPGDLLLLRTGDKVPADGRIIFESNLHVDESLLTGESVPIRKDVVCLIQNPHYYEKTNQVFAGSYVTEGKARVLVENTGDDTVLGEINKELQSIKKEKTTVMIRLERLSIFFIALAGVFLVTTLLLGFYRDIPSQVGLSEFILFALSALVSAIPEGLIAVITIVLSVGVYRLSRKKVIIRNLGVVETLGLINVICSDKTGTLTRNQMMVRRLFTPNNYFEVSGSGFNPRVGGVFIEGCGPTGCLRSTQLHEEVDLELHPDSKEPILGDRLNEFPDLEKLLAYFALCNDSELYSLCLDEDDSIRKCTGDASEWQIRGSPTEAALLVSLEKVGLHKYVLDEAWPRVAEIPFSSDRKYMATLHLPGPKLDAHESNLLIVKGAPERIESFLTTASGTEEVVSEFASQGLRVLACAIKYVPKNHTLISDEDLVGMEFVGLCGINDPPREGVSDYIKKSNRAGINVIMITGDNEFTAQAIGREVGVFDEERGDIAIKGDDIDTMDDEELKNTLEKGATVLARTNPFHKLRVVKALQETGKVVSMTGDGVNDSPALRQANVGIAMGITGTDISKEAADIVLQDERFETVVDGIEEGRNILSSLKRVVLFLTATNLAESFLILSILLLFTGNNLVLLLPLQILWVNLVTDGMLDIALSLEPKEKGLLDQSPGSLKDRVLSRQSLGRAIFYGIVMAAIVLVVYYQNLGFIANAQNETDLLLAQNKLRTMMFVTLIIVQWFSVQNCRSQTKSIREMGIFRNRFIFGVYVIDIFLVGILFLIPFMTEIFRLVPLGILEWLEIVLLGFVVLIIEEIRKAIASRRSS